jgi:small subunit ribosomal protein S6
MVFPSHFSGAWKQLSKIGAVAQFVVNFARIQVRHIRAFPVPASLRLEQDQTHGKEVSLMRKYELVCIIQPDLDETAFNGVLDKVKGWISDSGGSVDKVDVWGRRKMAYSIRKQKEGQYVLLNVTLNPTTTSELERNLRYQESVMRHMLSVVG